MSGDRFELELRDVLHEEATHAPVTLTIGDLRARAESRSRIGRWLGTGRPALGVAVAAIAALALFVSLSPSKAVPAVGGSPSVPPVGSATQSAAARSSFAALPILLGPAGTVLGFGLGNDSLDVVGTHLNGSLTPITHIIDLSARLGGWRVATDGAQEGAISSTGVLALTVTRGDTGHPEYATAIVPLFGTGPFPIVPARGGLAFETDGTIVIAGERVVSAPPPYDASEATIVPSGVTIAVTPDGRPSLMADGTGFYGMRQDAGPNADAAANVTPVVVRWDGSVSNADTSVDPMLITGVDRAFGADGQVAVSSDSAQGGTNAGLAVEGPATPRVETKIAGTRAFAWSRDGRILWVVTQTSLWMFDGRASHKVSTLRASSGADRIVGLTANSILLEGRQQNIAVHLDGSGEDGIGGMVVGVVG